MNIKNKLKKPVIGLLLGIMMFTAAMPSALAAKFYFSDETNLMKGCPATVQLMLDTEGSSVLAVDSTFDFSPTELTVNSLSIGPDLPTQTYNTLSGSTYQYSAARDAETGGFTGITPFVTLNLDISARNNSSSCDQNYLAVRRSYNNCL